MKTLREQLLEILYTKKIIGDKDLFELLKNGLHEAPLKDYAISSIMDRLVSNIESLIKENYVEKEFVEWSHNLKDKGIIFHNSDGLYSLEDSDLTLDELYNYWLTEIKSKEK